jgi:hypothetical protein
VINPADAERLRAVARRGGRSFLRYLAGAAPLAFSPDDRAAVAAIQECAAAEDAARNALAERLDEWRVTPPLPGSYPSAFADYNFLAVRAVLPKLADELRGDVSGLEDDLKALHDPAARDAVAALLRLKQSHLDRLTGPPR